MSEKIPELNTSDNFEGEEKESLEDQEKRGDEMLEAYLSKHKEEMSEPEEKLSEMEKAEKLEELEKMFSDFEGDFPLDELFAINTKEEALESPLREDARKRLSPLYTFIKELKKEADITNEEKEKIKERWEKISLAVGFINSGKVRHE